MTTISVFLTGPMKEWVDRQARSGRYSTTSDYISDLIRRDQERAGALLELQQLISEGVESGISPRSTDDVLKLAREQAEGSVPDQAV